MKLLSGVRARIVLVAIVVAAPMLGLELLQASQSRDNAISHATDRVVELARLAAANEDDSVQEAASVLRLLKLVPAVAQALPGECHALLRKVTEEHPRLDSISVVAADGSIACNSLSPAPAKVNVADRVWFIDVTQPDAPPEIVSEFLISRSTGQPTMVVGAGFGNPGLNPRAVAASAAMNLAWFSDIAARLPQAAGATVTVMDARDGTILARSANPAQWVGQHFPAHPLMALLRRQSEGVARVTDLDGVERIIGFRRLPGNAWSRTIVSVGIPVSVILAEADAQLRAGLAVTVLMLLAGVSMALVLASYSIIRPLDALGEAARRLGDGDVASSAAMPIFAVGELGRLAAVFNQAVAQIADRDLRLEKQAQQDALTGLANRRYFDETLALEWQQSLRTGRNLSLVMIDVDHFKRYNDSYGHPAGDLCLQTVAAAICDAVRQSFDTASRYGGEEFAIILPDTDVISAMRVAERLVRQINALAVPHVGANSGHLSISAGVATFNPAYGHADISSAQTLLLATDAALYCAKNGGRGRVVLHNAANTPATSPSLALMPAA